LTISSRAIGSKQLSPNDEPAILQRPTPLAQLRMAVLLEYHSEAQHFAASQRNGFLDASVVA
jgi:hypothetical protein